MNGVTERVERGAALLDEKRPDWWQEIDLGELDLRSRCDCVLGQIAGRIWVKEDRNSHYTSGLHLVGLGPLAGRDYGFDTDLDPDDCEHGTVEDGEEAVRREFAELTAAWTDLITRRRELAAVTA